MTNLKTAKALRLSIPQSLLERADALTSMMDRRAFLDTVTGGLLAAPLAAEAQQAAKVPRIGFLGNSTAALEANLVGSFREGLRDLGDVEGRNILISSPHFLLRFHGRTSSESCLVAVGRTMNAAPEETLDCLAARG